MGHPRLVRGVGYPRSCYQQAASRPLGRLQRPQGRFVPRTTAAPLGRIRPNDDCSSSRADTPLDGYAPEADTVHPWTTTPLDGHAPKRLRLLRVHHRNPV